MNPYPSPLLCLYCDKIILPGNFAGAKRHMFECDRHPAKQLIDGLREIDKLVDDLDDITACDEYESVCKRLDLVRKVIIKAGLV